MVERYEEDRRGAGWVWAIVGVIVAALVIWWIAAAVTDGPEDRYAAQTASEDSTNNTLAENVPDEDSQQAEPATEPQSDPTEVAGAESVIDNLEQWNKEDRENLDASDIDEGISYLSAAANDVAAGYSGELPEEGSQTGGGPPAEASQAVLSQRTKLEASVQDLKNAKSENYPETFHEVALNFVALLDGVQGEANLEDASGALEELHEKMGDLSATQALDEQKPAVEAFFDKGTEVLNKFADNLEQDTAD